MGLDTIGFLPYLLFSAVPMYDLPPELWNHMVQLAPVPSGTDLWQQMWLSLFSITCTREIPLTARNVCTPLSAPAWHLMLQDHPNTWLLLEICNRFLIGFTRSPESLKSARTNLEGARQRPEVITDYLSSEGGVRSCGGSFSSTCSTVRAHKPVWSNSKRQNWKWRLIIDHMGAV